MNTPISSGSFNGNVRQSALVNAVNDPIYSKIVGGHYHGIICKVHTIDGTSDKGIPYGSYTLYDVRLSPTGQIFYNVPDVGAGGHYTSTDTDLWESLPNFSVNPGVDKPSDSVQNTDETPYVIYQPVLVGFLKGNELTPIILGPLRSIKGGAGQTTAEYPKKYGSFQGAEWSIDKNGAVSLDVPATQDITIKVGGNVLCYIKDGEVDLGGSSGLELTALGETLQGFLDGVFDSVLGHTHTSAAPGNPTTPPVGVTVPTITASNVKVT